MRFNSKGFTLLELVMVIAIIGILVGGAIFIIRPDNQLRKARDSQRKTEMQKIASALENFKADIGRYPAFGTFAVPNYGWAGFGSVVTNSTTATYISPNPTGPKTDGNVCKGYVYAVQNLGRRYTLFIQLENSTDPKALEIKPAPNVVPTGGSTSDGYKTFSWTGGSCANTIFNYWINNP